ncbi:hypothetical protein HYH03_008110 [Edaphochlamys debaryana]|uniref:Uncharacterized protein n=1 Tax=Edaphochlamys debaryana TaxID=47281 RepID=A0A835XYW6_9CHLO|nr:hypothetical protein HYH03_008110 [Edaphochlamys debaryana]|eukprot:KAG2493592.1 hypothetical protein HYH03_008110 [Edaphochlamys debaryana]
MWSKRVGPEYSQTPGFCTPYNVGVNACLLPLIPYALSQGIHDTHLHLALILGTAFSGGLILLGLGLKLIGGYRTWPFMLELVMLVVNTVLLGVSYPHPDDVKKLFPLISNTVYAAFGILSVMMTAPFTLQYVREFVPPNSSTHEKVFSSAYLTTGVWTVAFTVNTLVYLAPLCTDDYNDHFSALNLIFRIILPICFAALAALVNRIWPITVLNHLIVSAGFDSAPRKIMVNPLALAGGFPPPGLGPGVPAYPASMPYPPVQLNVAPSAV